MRFYFLERDYDYESERHLIVLKRIIRNIESFQKFFLETLKQQNLNNEGNPYNSLGFTYRTEYHVFKIKAYISEDQILSIKTLDEELDDGSKNEQTYYFGNQKKIRFPNAIWKEYNNSTGFERIRHEFFLKIINTLNDHKIYINFETLRYSTYKFSDAMIFWSGQERNFEEFKIRVHSYSKDEFNSSASYLNV